MEMENIYENIEDKNRNTVGPQTLNRNRTEAQSSRRWFVVITVCLGLFCVLLVIALIVQSINLTAERDQMKMTNMNIAEEFNETLSNLKVKYSHLTNEKDQLQKNLKTINQKKLELETNNTLLTDERDQLQKSLTFVSQKKLELETNNTLLTNEKDQLQKNLKTINQKKLELETNNTLLTDERDQLQINLKTISQKKLELETNNTLLTDEKDPLQKSLTFVSQKKLELETRVKLLSEGSGRYSISNESKSWSESRQYCRDRGGDLIIINTEEEQKYISSLIKQKVWIGLSDIENEGKMKWVDNTPLNKGFWDKGEPNDEHRHEDCVEILPTKPVLNNWNDIPCSETRKWICEK